MSAYVNRIHPKLILVALVVLGTSLLGCGTVTDIVPTAKAGLGHKDACGVGTPVFCTAIFSSPAGVAVDNSSGANKGDVYVVDIGHNRIVKFNSAGAELGVIELTPLGVHLPIWNAVDPTSGDVYVADFSGEGNAVYKLEPSGSLVAGFGTGGKITVPANPAGVGIDPTTGNLIVSSRASGGTITEYNSTTGAEVSSFSSGLSAAAGLAVDSAGNIYAVNEYDKVVKYPKGERTNTSVLDGNRAYSVAIDPSTGEIYVDENAAGSEIAVFNSSGVRIQGASFGFGNFGGGGAPGLAVYGATHTVYAMDISNNAGVLFEAGPTPETPETGTATEITGGTAKLHGTLNPGGMTGELGYHFAFNAGLTCEGGSTTTPGVVAEGKEAPVEAEATGLSPKTKYTFCLVSTNAFGSTFGSGVPFETLAGLPKVEEESVVEIIATSAKLAAKINPSGAATTCTVKYGLTEAYGSEKPCPAVLEGTTGQPTSVTLSGLEPNQTYHFRFFATNEKGTTEFGTDATFLTTTTVEGETVAATEVTAEGAQLNGQFIASTPAGGSYQFEYGTASVGEHTTPKIEITHETTGFEAVSATVTGLLPRALYHFRLVAFEKGSLVPIPAKSELTFTTLATKPAVSNSPLVRPPTRTTATLSGTIDPKNSETQYDIEYGETEAYGKLALPEPGFDITTAKIEKSPPGPLTIESRTLEELKAGITYHYRIVATNEVGTTFGPDGTFTTAPAQPPSVKSEFALATSQTSAKLTDDVSPNGLPTMYVLELGADTSYGTSIFGQVPKEKLNEEGKLVDEPMEFALTSLTPGATYHYRIVAMSADGISFGGDVAFTTPGFASSITEPPRPLIVPLPPEEREPREPRPPTRHELLVKALRKCAKEPRKKRAACVKRAERKYGSVRKTTKKKK